MLARNLLRGIPPSQTLYGIGWTKFSKIFRFRRFLAETGAHPGEPNLDLAALGSDLAALRTVPREREHRFRPTGDSL